VITEEPPRGAIVRIVSSNAWNGLTFQRRATDDPQGRDAWFGMDNDDGGLWSILQHRAEGGHIELVDGTSRLTAVESVAAWNPKVSRFRANERNARTVALRAQS
jgi:hypothetical protein